MWQIQPINAEHPARLPLPVLQRVLRITPLEQRADQDSWRPWHSQPMFQPTDDRPPASADLIVGGNSQLPGNRLPEQILAEQVGRRIGPGEEQQQFTIVAEA